MEFEIEEYPWKHIVIDDFLDDYAMEMVTSVKEEDYRDKRGYRNPRKTMSVDSIHFGASVTDEGSAPAIDNSLFDILPESFIQHMYDNYLDKLQELYTALTGEVIEDPKMFLEWRVVKPGYESIMHVDIPRKKLSIVVYISEEGDGTKLYCNDDDEDPAKVIPWKKNRAFIFARETEVTWHRFGCFTKDTPRITFGFNLAHKNHKGLF